jgi:tetratricopeptide (TPR) repeat protein
VSELEIKRRANEFLHKGRYPDAIAEYEKLLAERKKPNPAILNLIGDLHIKAGNYEKGFEYYLLASRAYADEGLFHNGIAVGKKVLRMDADQTEVYGMLGQLYARQGLGVDCIKFLTDYANRKEKEGEYPAALASFAEACEILPDFPEIHIAYGEMLEQVDRLKDAASAFDTAATAFDDRQMLEEAEQWRRRARAARGEEPGAGTGDVRELMNLRTLDDAPAARPSPPARPSASRPAVTRPAAPRPPAGKPAPRPAAPAPADDPWGRFDPARNPEIPPPPPLPGRRPAARPARPAPPQPEITHVPVGRGRDGVFDLEIEPPSAVVHPPAAEVPPPPAGEPLELQTVDDLFGGPAAPPGPADSGVHAPPEVAAPAAMDSFFRDSGVHEAPELGSERAVIVGDDTELVREGGDVQEVINDFREATMDLLDLDDHQAHYDLGTTYMEMELFDEAAAEFEISALGPEYILSSQEMLGYCFLRKGQIDLAIRELKKGLAVEGYDDRDKLGLLYNLGVASRVLDKENEAIEYFRRIVEIDPDFRDTRERLERLVQNSA